MSFYDRYYQSELDIVSDIYMHLPKLYELACTCRSIVEFGVGFGRSTSALIASLEKTGGYLDSYDIACLDGVTYKFDYARQCGLNATFHLRDTFEAEFTSTDMLFVDSKHTFYQVTGELLLHGDKVRKYIAFHDVALFGNKDEFGDGPGILPAIDQWRYTHPEWITIYETDINNGLLVIERR